MNQKNTMTISEFAKMTGMKRANLIFYDNIGLLSPEFRGTNDYRYYTRRQLGTAYLIISLRELGIGLEEIRSYAESRDPEKMLVLFDAQSQRIDAEIAKLKTMKQIMHLYQSEAVDALKNESAQFTLENKKREAIFLGRPITEKENEDTAMIHFYHYASDCSMDQGYPMGTIVSRKQFENKKDAPLLHYYFKVKQGGNAWKPEGLYASVYGRCSLGKSDELYRQLKAFIESQNCHIISDAYEEYPLNEISVKNEKQYCAKIEVLVERR